MDEVTFRERVLNQLKVKVERVIPREVVRTLEADFPLDFLTDKLVVQLRARVLAEQLPPQAITRVIRVVQEDPRHATWWDHLKATYRGRWWWPAWLSTVRTVQTKVAIYRTVAVEVRPHWAYPEAEIPIPDMGQPVMVCTWGVEDFPSY